MSSNFHPCKLVPQIHVSHFQRSHLKAERKSNALAITPPGLCYVLICERHAHSWYRVTLVWFCAGRRCSASRWRSRSRWSVVAGSREPSGTCWWWTCARQQMRARTPLCTTATHTSLVHSASTEVNNCKLNSTDINWPAVSRPSYTTHHDAFIGHARQRHDLTGCSETTRLANKNEATNSWP